MGKEWNEGCPKSISSPALFAYALIPALAFSSILANFATPSRFLAKAEVWHASINLILLGLFVSGD
jgi:hypothetical protein